MGKNNKEVKKVYTTLDSYQAGWLLLRKHTPKLIEQGSKVVFCFDASNALYQDLDDYNSGALIEASRFAFAIKSLKSRIHSLRKNKEQWGKRDLDTI